MMTGEMAAKMICLTNRKNIIMNSMRLRLENIIKSKGMKKLNNLPVQSFKNVQSSGKIRTRIVTKFLTQPWNISCLENQGRYKFYIKYITWHHIFIILATFLDPKNIVETM